MIRPSTLRILVGLILVLMPGMVFSMIGSVDCEGSESVNLRLGLPTNVENPELYAKNLESILRDFGRCADTAEVSVDIAYGSDYEILHWLTLGLVDAALVEEVAQYLLRQEGVQIVEIPLEEKRRPACRERLEYWDSEGGKKTIEWGNSALQTTLEWHWCQAVARTVGDDDLQGILQSGGCQDLPQAPSLLVFPSHLGFTAFAKPMGKIQEWFESRLQRLSGHCESCVVPLGKKLAESYWSQVMGHSRFTLGKDLSTLPSGNRALLSFTAEEDPLPREKADGQRGDRGGSRLVMAREWAERLMGPIVFQTPESNLPAAFMRLLRQETQAMRAFWPLHKLPDQLFRVRAFQFTLEESVSLIRSHQKSSQQAALALVLPGGGVKAAYQTPVVEELYSRRHLMNSKANGDLENGKEPLGVDVVIGTSGGALLGYFVARLDSRLNEDVPWTMVDLLWKKPHKGGRKVLESQDVFGLADMLRFFSLMVIFLIFCCWLFIFSFGRRTPFYSEPPSVTQGWRPRLFITVLPLMVLTPFFVRYVNGVRAFEHIPVVEGLFYTVFVWILLFADQCLECSEPRSRTKPTSQSGVVLLVLGLAAVSIPLVARKIGGFENDLWLDNPVSFWAGYLAFGVVALGGGLVLPVRWKGPGEISPTLRVRSWVEVGVASVLAFGGVNLLYTTGRLETSVSDPFFSLLLLALLLFAANYFSVRSSRWSEQSLRRKVVQWLAPFALARYYVQLGLAAFFIALFCRSVPESGASFMEVLQADSILQFKWGSFLICFGVLFLLLASLHWMHHDSKGRYTLTRVASYLGGLLVIVGHLLVVYLVLIVGTIIFPDRISLLELTPEFWTGLLAVSALSGLLMMLWGAWWGWPKSLGTLLNYSLQFLASHHHVRGLVTRRFLRILLMATASVLWWNLVIAPAFYGNQPARTYLQEADSRFRSALSGITEDPPELPLTTTFLTPTNDLGKRRSSVFAFFPGEGDCPVFRSRPGSAAEWLVYRVVQESLDANPGDPCWTLSFDQKGDREMVKSVVFASGSPFPVFPAHRVEVSRSPEPSKDGFRSLVDGGYSNNVPVDLALSAEAAQVLIVHSSPIAELSADPSKKESKRVLPGPLARNLNRLPGYLFQRSQQVDLMSREAMFVVSLSPSKEAQAQLEWPNLVDFRASTIEKLEELALEDLSESRRIGWVESWGRPRFGRTTLSGEDYERGL